MTYSSIKQTRVFQNVRLFGVLEAAQLETFWYNVEDKKARKSNCFFWKSMD